MPVVQSILFFLLAGVVFAILGTLASAAIARAVGPRITRLEPRARYRALVLLASLPLLWATALLLSASLPSLLSLAVPELDHCLTHDDGHAHLCFVHLPSLPANVPVVLGLTSLGGYLFARSTLSAAELIRASRLVRVLRRSGVRRDDLGALLLETPAPLCLTAGLFRPAVLISRGLVELLTADERTIVLAHEHAHARRKDALVANLVRPLSALHLPKLRTWIMRELEIAAEQVCDEEAGRVTGDRTAVAAAILTVERATRRAGLGRLRGVAVGAGACAVERRVCSLLADPLASPSFRPLYFALALAVAATLAVADPLHHATEAFLSVLAH